MRKYSAYGKRPNGIVIVPDDPEFLAEVQERRIARMEMIDRYPAEIRALVHEYGWAVVNALIDVGVKKPKQIRHVVEVVLNEFSPTRGTGSAQGTRAAKGLGEE